LQVELLLAIKNNVTLEFGLKLKKIRENNDSVIEA